MMNIEKLIENAKVCCGDIETEDCSQYCINPRDSRDGELRWCRQWLIHDLHTAVSALQAENEKLRAELERVKRALSMMWFAYVNSDKETPHGYETEAIEEAERLLGPWEECMPKYLRRGQKED